MRRLARSALALPGLAWQVLRATGGTFARNRILAGVSLLAAFAIWFVVEDIENPRKEGTAPVSGAGIVIEVVNRAEGLIVDDLPEVRVRVEAREADLPNLRPGDFRATVDAKGLTSAQPESRAVRVESRREGVKVLWVEPATVEVRMITAATKEVPVEIHQTGELPAGYRLAEAPVVEPAFVTISGRPELVDSVQSVQLDVNLSGVRSETFEHEGGLVARAATGNEQTVELSATRAKATFKIAQVFTQRTLPVLPVVTGVPATGFRVSAVTWDPQTVTVTGLKAVIDSLPGYMTTEALTIAGARTEVTAARNLEHPPNVSLDRQSVTIKVKVEAFECGGQAGGPFPAMLFVVAPTVEGLPAGLTVAPGSTLSVQVRVAGPFTQLATLKANDIRASVSLAGAVAGTGTFPVTVTVPQGLRVEGGDTTIPVTLAPVTP